MIEFLRSFDPRRALARIHANQQGAVAFMVLCALLIVMMMAWALFDAQESAREALDVQAAADTAAWSQSAVESRSMNTISFANIAKRIVFGTAAYYQALWIAFIEILAIAVILSVACIIVDVLCFGCITSICEKVIEFTVEVGLMMIEELPDLVTLETDLFTSHWLADIQALDAYQQYMSDLTPWWGWAEAYSRGSRNGATVVGSWPVPKTVSSLGLTQTGLQDSLPIRRGTGEAWMTDLCLRSWGGWDIVVFLAEYIIKNEINDAGNWKRMLAHVIAGPLAAFQFPAGCGINWLIMGQDQAIQPWQIKSGYSNSTWLRDTSNIVFSYHPDIHRMTERKRRKYMYISKGDDDVPLLYDGGGSFGMARSEITFQSGEPDLWHTSWSARMRPVALPGEWSGLPSNQTLLNAWHDVLPYIAIGAVLNTAIQTVASGISGSAGSGSNGDDFDFEAVLSSTAGDFLKMEGAFGGLSQERIEGLPK